MNAESYEGRRAHAVSLISAELDHAEKKYGRDRNLPMTLWVTIIGEEYGEICRDVLEHNKRDHLISELAQTACVCQAAIIDLLSGSKDKVYPELSPPPEQWEKK